MTFKEKYLQDHPERADSIDAVIRCSCPIKYGYDIGHVRGDYCFTTTCIACWDREIPGTEKACPFCNDDEKESERKMDILDKIRRGIPEADPNAVLENEHNEMIQRTPRILDSGNRREFPSGAVRDIQEGKGRCDLLPLDVVAEYMEDAVLLHIGLFINNGNVGHLFGVLRDAPARVHFADHPTMFLEVAKHFEEGAKKYGDSNWQKGIPVRCYIDSAVRHYLKFLRGDKDEPHDRAFCWNILCAIWTCKHKPELNDYAKES